MLLPADLLLEAGALRFGLAGRFLELALNGKIPLKDSTFRNVLCPEKHLLKRVSQPLPRRKLLTFGLALRIVLLNRNEVHQLLKASQPAIASMRFSKNN